MALFGDIGFFTGIHGYLGILTIGVVGESWGALLPMERSISVVFYYDLKLEFCEFACRVNIVHKIVSFLQSLGTGGIEVD